MDLQTFIESKMMLTTAVMGLQTRTQAYFTQKMSKNTIHERPSLPYESSDYSDTRDNTWQSTMRQSAKRNFYSHQIARKLFQSQDPVDQRMLKLHKISAVHKTEDLTSASQSLYQSQNEPTPFTSQLP